MTKLKSTDRPPVFNNLIENYEYLGLPVDLIDPKNDFTIHRLMDIHGELPFKSCVYRANFYSFLFIKDGEGRYTTDDLEFHTKPRTIYFTNPGHYKSFEWHCLKEVYLVTMSESFLKENVHANIFEEFPFLLAETVPARVLSPEVFAEFEPLYTQIYKEYFSNSPYKNKMIGNLFVVLLLKIKEYFWEDYNPIYEGNRSSQIVKNFKRTLEKHYRELASGKAKRVFRSQDYANEQNLHPNYLNNVIKAKTGKSVSTWIIDKTITEAKSLLQNSGTPIKQIADQLGFAESAHFSNYFKKYTDTTPALYRKHLGTGVP